jgi:hypothetical protein
VISGPGAVDAGTNNWTYLTDCSDLGTVEVCVEVTDDAGQVEVCCFDLTVTNTAPNCTDPADITAPTGVPQVVVLGPLVDVDGDDLTYTQVPSPTEPPWGGIVGNEWQGTRPPGDDNVYMKCFEVSDGCEVDTCWFNILFESPYIVYIVDDDSLEEGIVSRYGCTLRGRNKSVCVWVDPATGSSGLEGGFDFLVCYDASGLSFLNAERGGDLHPTWEYFTYRTGMFGGNCGGGCPDGFVRLVGIADMNNGVNPDPDAFDLAGCIVELEFYVTNDENFIGSCFHVGFCSYDCGDNVISSKDGNTLFLALPGPGVSYGFDWNDDGECFEGGGPDKPAPVPFITFCGGSICVCEPPDDRGDINLNGIANEIGDAVLFSNYFITGPSVWDPDFRDTQEHATEINNDGIVLTIADLVYLIRIITGDETPFPPDNQNPKVAPYATSVDVISEMRNGTLSIRTNAAVDLGGAVLVFRYSGVEIGEPSLMASTGLKMKARANSGELRVLIHPDMAVSGSRVPAGVNTLVTIPVSGDGAIELVETQFSDASGALLAVSAAKASLPTSYALQQNFPNPFNAGTVIPIALKSDGEWTLTIYNVAGQAVRTFSGADEAGIVNVVWDGTMESGASVASGMYFYRVNAGDFTATKKMVLLK